MNHLQQKAFAHDLAACWDAGNGDVKSSFPEPKRSRPADLNLPNGLAASSDANVLQDLADMMCQCGLATFIASTVNESRRILERHDVCLVLCDERLADGGYQEILAAVQKRSPVIVVSPTGEAVDYLKAIGAGAFDYLAHRPIPEELPRVIRSALVSGQAKSSEGIASGI